MARRSGDLSAVAMVLLASLAFEVFLLIRPGGDHLIGVVDNVALASGAGIGGFACWQRALREEAVRRAGWAFIAAGSAVFAIVELGFAVHFVPWFPIPRPGESLLDWVAVPISPLMIAGLACIGGTPTVTGRLITVLDGFVLGLSYLFVSWAVVLAPVYRHTTAKTTAQIFLLYFIAGSLAASAIAVALAMRWAGDPLTLVLLVISFLWQAATQVGFGEVSIRGGYRTGNVLIDIGWFTPFFLLALAARRRATVDRHATLRRRSELSLAMPYGAVVLAAVTADVLWLLGTEFDRLMAWTLVSLLAVVFVRLVVTLRENRALTVELERRVEERSRAALSSEERLQAVLHNSADVIALTDGTGQISYASPATVRIFGHEPAQLVGKPIQDLLHPNDRESVTRLLEAAGSCPEPVTLTCRVADGCERWRPVEATVSRMIATDLSGNLVLNIRDVSDRIALQEKIEWQALHDELTALANRTLLHERLHHALARTERTGADLAVLYIDLDQFKFINDTGGHAAGDAILTHVARELISCLRPSDTAARLGGDEFAVLLEDTSSDDAVSTAHRILRTLSTPCAVGGQTYSVTASIGLRTRLPDNLTSEELLRDADIAMYEAKAAGGDQVIRFDQHMQDRLSENIELARRLRNALDENQLTLHYQPMFDLATGELCGFEALARWRDQDGVNVPPSIFIPVAEQRGLIKPIDRFVLRAACKQLQNWQQLSPTHEQLRMNVNMSALELREPGVIRDIHSILEETGLQPHNLTLEITETAVHPDLDAAASVLSSVRELGIAVSLDDFGTGYSSLATLRTVPLDEIKIDKSFVDAIDTTPSHQELVKAIVALARSLGLRTVAEAVETPEQLTLLRSFGCSVAQGFLLAVPMSANDITDMLQTATTGRTAHAAFRAPAQVAPASL